MPSERKRPTQRDPTTQRNERDLTQIDVPGIRGEKKAKSLDIYPSNIKAAAQTNKQTNTLSPVQMKLFSFLSGLAPDVDQDTNALGASVMNVRGNVGKNRIIHIQVPKGADASGSDFAVLVGKMHRRR